MRDQQITITVISNPTPEHRAEHQHAALRYVTATCESLEGYDDAVARIERNHGMALPAELKHYSRMQVEQRLAQQEE